MKQAVDLVVGCLFAVLAFSPDVSAQPRLDQRTLPAPPKQFTLVNCDSTGVNPGPGGAGVLWQFNNLIPRFQEPVLQTVLYVDNSSLPPELRDSFPQASIGIIDDTVASAFRVEGQSLRLLGVSTPTANQIVSVADPYDTRPTEIVYNEPYTDSWQAVIWPKITGQPMRRRGNDTLIYDGYGTLFLPKTPAIGGVARTTRRSATKDTLRQGPRIFVTTTHTETSTWQRAIDNIILLEIVQVQSSTTRNGVLITPITRRKTVRAQQWDTSVTSVDEESAVEESRRITVFPNPVTYGELFINNLPFKPGSIYMIDVTGQRLPGIEVRSVGNNNWQVLLSNTAAGYYTLVAESNCGTEQCPTFTHPVIVAP